MAKRPSQAKKKSGIKSMKLIAIKKECYAISGVATTAELKRKYPTLCSDRDFRKRINWEYLLKNLRVHGDWIGISISDIEHFEGRERKNAQAKLSKLSFHLGRVEMDQAAENDD